MPYTISLIMMWAATVLNLVTLYVSTKQARKYRRMVKELDELLGTYKGIRKSLERFVSEQRERAKQN